jgi:flagellar basal-body rod protein FlgB
LGPIYLFDLASQQANWLSVRQATIARNIANANTPGFTALEVKPFQDVLDQAGLRMATTNVHHIALGGEEAASAAVSKDTGATDVTTSGNSVSVERELMKAGDVNRGYSLNMAVVKAFNRMLLESVKS